MRRREAAKAQGGVALGRSGRKPFANQLSCIAEEGKRVLRAHTLSPHLVSLRFVSTLRPYALSKVKEELMGGFSSSRPVLPVLPCLPVLPVLAPHARYHAVLLAGAGSRCSVPAALSTAGSGPRGRGRCQGTRAANDLYFNREKRQNRKKALHRRDSVIEGRSTTNHKSTQI